MLENIIHIIKEKLGINAKIVKQLNTINNKVYIIENGGKEYIFKIYHSKNWPEDGKLLFVNDLLKSKNVKTPKVIAYDRNSESFTGGYVIEERIKGKPALEINDLEINKLMYINLANIIKKAHNITFKGYGYLNNGSPYYDTLGEYLSEIIIDNINIIKSHNCNIIDDSKQFANKLCSKLQERNYCSVLCHGDLSFRNVIYNQNEIFL